MAEKTAENLNGPSKSFMTAGPTLHYSHANVRRYWALAVVVYIVACGFWSKILTGEVTLLHLTGLLDSDSWELGQFVVSPLSIYEYPWQIVVLGMLMGIMGVCPALVSQLLRFRYSVPLILAVVFIARLPLFGVFLAVSCVAAACRPLRFRSRFIAIALCMAPQLVYWAVFGGYESVEPVRWGFSFAPWIYAWLTGLAIAGAIIGIGHFTRYRPGLVWSVNFVALAATIFIFQWKISFAELDYQLYIAGNNPEEVREFHDHQMADAIDQAIKDPSTGSFLAGLFYPAEPILLREKLKGEIQTQLGYDRWPNWFERVMPDELRYQDKRRELLRQYDLFIRKRPHSRRMPVALYYKAMLNEYSPDIRLFGQAEVLRFYNDYPHREALPIWYRLYDQFGQSSESIEARWRIARHLAGQAKFEKALELCDQAKIMLAEKLKQLQEDGETEKGSFLTAFAAPASTVMPVFKLRQLHRKLWELEELIGGQNHTDRAESKNRLARFVIMNPHGADYTKKLDDLLSTMKENDVLRDNILLAKIMLLADAQLRGERFKELSELFSKTDGGIRALYESGILKVRLWQEARARGQEDDRCLAEARAILDSFIKLYPKSIFNEQAKVMLDSLAAP